jgi:hypothetical protein
MLEGTMMLALLLRHFDWELVNPHSAPPTGTHAVGGAECGLERGYSFKPSPAESALRLEIGELQAELEAERQQQSAAEFELPEPADLLNQ